MAVGFAYLVRSLKYEEVFLHAYENLDEARAGIDRYFEFYNMRRPHRRVLPQAHQQGSVSYAQAGAPTHKLSVSPCTPSVAT